MLIKKEKEKKDSGLILRIFVILWKEFKKKIKIHFPNKIRATDKCFLRPKLALYWEERGKGELTAKHDIFIPKKKTQKCHYI